MDISNLFTTSLLSLKQDTMHLYPVNKNKLVYLTVTVLSMDTKLNVEAEKMYTQQELLLVELVCTFER